MISTSARRGALWLSVLSACAGSRVHEQGGGESGKPYLWKVTAPSGRQAFLAGSIHLGSGDLLMDRAMLSAFEGADALAVEANVLDPAVMQRVQELAFERGTYPPGEGLSQLVSPEQLARLQQAAKERGIAPEVVERMRPWLLSITFAAAQLTRAGFQPSFGLDHYFLARAPESSKHIAELETPEEQITALSYGEDAMHLRLLEEQLGQDVVAMVGELRRAYLEGDDATLARLLFESADSSAETRELYERTFTMRNETMAQAMGQLMQQERRWFFLIGAGHLLGQGSVIERLRDLGYEVLRLDSAGVVSAPLPAAVAQSGGGETRDCVAVLPGDPETSSSSTDDGQSAARTRFVRSQHGGLRFVLTESHLTAGTVPSRAHVDVLYGEVIRGLASSAKLTLMNMSPIAIDGLAGREFSLESESGAYRGRVVLVGDRLCSVGAVGPKERMTEQGPAVEAFLASFGLGATEHAL